MYMNLYCFEAIIFIHLSSILNSGIISTVFVLIDEQPYGYAS